MPNSDVMIPVEGGSMGAYCAEPQDPNGGGIVILQEIFGVNANLRAVADTFAGQGYVVVVPDLFWRQERDVQLDPNDKAAHEKATTLMKRLDQPQALRDAQRAVDWLRARPDVGGGIGVMGYCLGGKLAYQLAGGPGIAAIAVYYGTGLHTVLGPLDGFAGKMLLHVAEADHLCPPAAQAAIREAHGRDPRVELVIHGGAGHAFARQGGAHFDAAAADRANAATSRLFAETLTGG